MKRSGGRPSTARAASAIGVRVGHEARAVSDECSALLGRPATLRGTGRARSRCGRAADRPIATCAASTRGCGARSEAARRRTRARRPRSRVSEAAGHHQPGRAHRVISWRDTDVEEDVGVVLDDQPVEPADSSCERDRTSTVAQVEPLVCRGRARARAPRPRCPRDAAPSPVARRTRRCRLGRGRTA